MWRRKAGNARRGATAVEFAFAAPLLFMLVFGLIEFGRMMMAKQSVTNAAREGCRTAALATTTSEQDVDDAVRHRLQGVICDVSNPDKLRVSMDPSSLSDISSGAPISVDVEVNYTDVSWLPGSFLSFVGDPVISGRATQERE